MAAVGLWCVTMVPMLFFIQAINGLKNGYVRELNYMCKPRPKAGLMAVPWDCNGFVQCNHYFAIWTNCATSLVFDPVQQTCVSPPVSGPCRYPEERAKMFCPGMPGLKFLHPKSCAMFYDCSQVVPQFGLGLYENECKYPMLFDKYELVCKEPENAKCGDSPRTRDKCSYQLECLDEACRGLPDGKNPVVGKLFLPEYLECASQLVVSRSACTGSMVFDPVDLQCSEDVKASITKICERLPGLKFPASTSCSKYYDCSTVSWNSALDPYQRECPYFQLWDPITFTCSQYTSVTCDGRFQPKAPCDYTVGQCATGTCIPCEATCVGAMDGKLAFPGNNKKYIECKDERTISIDNCAGNYVFWEARGACVDPSIVPLTTTIMTTTSEEATTVSAATTSTTATTTTTTTTEATTAPTTTVTTETTTTTTTTAAPSTTVTTTITTTTPTASQTTTSMTTPTCTTNDCIRDNRIAALEDFKRKTELANKYCFPPPSDQSNRIVSLSYSAGVTRASYACSTGYSICGVAAIGTCKGDQWKQPPSRCVRNVWGPPMTVSDVQVGCPLTPWSRIQVVGVLGSFNSTSFNLMKENDSLLEVTFTFVDSTPPCRVEVSRTAASSTVFEGSKEVDLYPGDDLDLNVRLGMNEYFVFINDINIATVPYVDQPTTADRIVVDSGLQLGSRLEISNSNLLQLETDGTTAIDLSTKGYIVDGNFFTFGVEACEDVTVTFSLSSSDFDTITINLGSNGNTVSTVRACSTCTVMTKRHSPLVCGQSRQFWVSLYSINPVKVNVGTGFVDNRWANLIFQGAGYRPTSDLGEGVFQKVTVMSNKGKARWSISQPDIERCGSPLPMPNSIPLLLPETAEVQYRCSEDFAFCGTSDKMTCAKDNLWKGLMGTCVKSVYKNIQKPLPGRSAMLTMKCRFYESSAVSLHLMKGSEKITIKLIDLAGDMHLVMTIFEGGFGMHTVKGGVEMNAVNTPGVSFTTGEERHVVIYNSDTGFKIYVDGQLAGTYNHTDTAWKKVKMVDVDGFEMMKIAEVAPTVSGMPTCSPPTRKGNSTVVAEDLTLGAMAAYECVPDFIFCGDTPTITCSSDGSWSGGQGSCVQTRWLVNKVFNEEEMTFRIPLCLYTNSGTVTVKVQLELKGGPFYLELRPHHAGYDPHRLDITEGVGNLNVAVTPDATATDIPSSDLLVTFTFNISADQITYSLGTTVFKSVPITYSNFDTLAIGKKGVLLQSVDMRS
ncbi:uncharacterized protein LOC124110914 [Haliotis rufescens]|uniref:uncharacterized protein LOC124110914 n=1 Tax=Haliotis rufescens TaxID=6454 RepID=UPI00201EF689|nr:uncharacterized protein LOC124110914 [Haliotis rufescens]XP_048249991.1 uncharacterized protein LOC124110914 [Haliotis rufescens]XP_048249992.1 uncharacterized protein LOC124110914 [Haliotis rufescens]